MAMWQKLLAGAVIVFALALPKPIHAAFRPQVAQSFDKRALNVKKAIEKMAPEMTSTDAPPSVMRGESAQLGKLAQLE